MKSLALLLATTVMVGVCHANPSSPTVVSGNVTINAPSNNVTEIHQSTPKGIINWKSFNIDKGQRTSFYNGNGVTLNRVTSAQSPSMIYGTLTATGKVILINQSGIYFGPSARVDVAGIMASTSDLSDSHFLNGRYIFERSAPGNAAVVNQGEIIARNGLVALVGSAVSNEGIIQARLGQVVLASGNRVTVDLTGDQLINFTIDEPARDEVTTDAKGRQLKHAVNNSGSVYTDGGTILMAAKTAKGVLDNAINMSGVAVANSFSEKNGVIILSAGENGSVNVSGQLVAKGGKGTKGGKIKVLGGEVTVASTAKIDASGDKGGGEILIGGNYQGKGPDYNAKKTTVEKGAAIYADAFSDGNGGTVILWSDHETRVNGDISARGGEAGGDGGFVETSGKHYLEVEGIQVDTRAPYGKTGSWLLDPTDLTICASCVSDTNQEPGYFSSTNGNSYLSATDLVAALAMSQVIVQTNSSGSGGNGDIIIDTPITWSSANDLTLTAYRHINANATITNTGGANVSLIADNTGTGTGTVTFSAGNVALSGGSGIVRIYYNPATFGVPTASFYLGGTTPVAYQLIHALGSPTDASNQRTLGALSNNSSLWSQYFALSKDIDAASTSTWNVGAGFLPVGNLVTPFTGAFNGQGFVIKNIYINAVSDAVGLFGYASGASTTIENIGVTDANVIGISAGNNYTGILVGLFENGLISRAYSTGVVSGGTSGGNFGVGGLVGSMNSATVSNSYSTADVGASTYQSIGGLVGGMGSSSIIDSYATGDVTGYPGGGCCGSSNIGGLLGYLLSGSINGSYATGLITSNEGSASGLVGNGFFGGPVTQSYWNTTTSGYGFSFFGGTGLTTAQMQQQANFVGWDFTNTWGIIEGNTYPYLQVLQRGVTGFATGGAGNTVALVVNGSDPLTTLTGVGGSYYFVLERNKIPDTSHALLYLSGAATKGNAIIMAPVDGKSISSVNIIPDNITVYTSGMSNTLLIATKGAQVSSDIIYSGSGSALSLRSSTLTTYNSSINYVIDGDITTASGSTAVNFAGPVSIINTVNIDTTGNQDYLTSFTLGGNATLSSGGTISLSGGVSDINGVTSGVGSLTLSAPTIDIIPAIGAVNPLNSLTLSSGSNLSFMGMTVNTTGNQDYQGSLTLTANTVLTSDGAISFSSPVNSGAGFNLQLVGGGLSYAGGIGIGTLTFTGSGSSDLNSLSINVPSAMSWNINGTNGTIGGGVTATYSNIGNIVGGSGGDTFTIDGTLNNLTGGNGTNRFNLVGNAKITGTLDGGTIANVNTIDLSGYTGTVNINLTAKTSNVLSIGTLEASGVTIASFRDIADAIGNGGSIIVPNSSVLSIKKTASMKGEIGDPFYFNNFNTPQVQEVQVAVDTSASATVMSSDAAPAVVQQSIFNYVNEAMVDILATQEQIDYDITNSQEFGCI